MKSLSCIYYNANYNNINNNNDTFLTINNQNTKNIINKNNNESTGLFDRFIKNYNSTQSVLDEPELSFVTYSSSLPSKNNSPRNNNNKLNTACSLQLSETSTSNCSLNNQTINSLINIQKKQLNKQFANVSPIEMNNRFNNNLIETTSSLGTTLKIEEMETNRGNNIINKLKYEIKPNSYQDEKFVSNNKSDW